MPENAIDLRGEYCIEARDADTGALLWRKRLKNQLTTINQTIRAQMLMGTYSGTLDALQIKYFAFGSGTTPATPNDTQLENEQLRKQVTQISNPTNGTVSSVLSLGSTEANNFAIREIGVFCGAGATATANSGTLLSRIVTQIDKNSNIVLNVVRSDICTI